MSNQQTIRTTHVALLRSTTTSGCKAKMYVRLIINNDMQFVSIDTLMLVPAKDVSMLTNFNDRYRLLRYFKDSALVHKSHVYKADTLMLLGKTTETLINIYNQHNETH